MKTILYLFHFNLKTLCNSFSLGGAITKCTERCCHKHNNSLTAELNAVPLYTLLCAACKPPAVILHEAASLSAIHVWTGHNCGFCCQEKEWRGVPIFSVCPCLFYYYQRQQRWKITGVSSRLPFETLTKSSGPQTSKNSVPDLSRGVKASSFLAQSVLLKYFLWSDLVARQAEVLFHANQTQHKVSCQKVCISLTDALWTSSKCYVHWSELLFWSISVYLCLWGIMKSFFGQGKYQSCSAQSMILHVFSISN